MSLRGRVLLALEKWRMACAVLRRIDRTWSIGTTDGFISAESGFYSVRVWVRACSECSLSESLSRPMQPCGTWRMLLFCSDSINYAVSQGLLATFPSLEQRIEQVIVQRGGSNAEIPDTSHGKRGPYLCDVSVNFPRGMVYQPVDCV
jgi:hypothetical protein